MQRKTEEMAPLFVARWPQELHRRLKIQAAARRMTFREVLIEAAEVLLSGGKRKKRER